ncbi:MAG: GWxTD domain-containing protein [bacterium]|nr:GWxTD domain-containing protein [candidate division KSB1 bacterium]MDH7560388.1 GWxTD domain-containing protein [bacterium]
MNSSAIRALALAALALLPLSTNQASGAVADSVRAPLQFTVDFARFRSPEDHTFLETYISLPRSTLMYQRAEDGRLRAEFLVDALLFSGADTVAHRAWRNVDFADSLAETRGAFSLFTVGQFNVPRGHYRVDLLVVDTASRDTARAIFDIKAIAFPDSGLCLSDLQLAAQISRDTTHGQFTKGNYLVLPNPPGIYGTTLPILYFYAEVYNLTYGHPGDSASYRVNYFILNGEGQRVKAFPSSRKTKPGTSAVEVGGLNIITLPSGTYYIVLEVEDPTTGERASVMKKFFVYREGETFAAQQQKTPTGKGSPGLDAERYNVMSEKELDHEFEVTRYINTAEDRATWKKLNLAGKRNFLRELWARMDQTPGTPENEFKQDYLARVAEANAVFRGFREGWKTDRGRILLQYGRPDEIERFPFSAENKAYHIWHYYSVQGGVMFIFVDKREMGDFELVHSTARGELFDADWQRWIDPNR